MNDTMETIREGLKEREREIVESIEALPDDMHQRDDHVGDSIDKSVAQVDHASASALREREIVKLHAVRDALARMEEGIFTECEGCGDDIPIARLSANPLTRFCVTCQEEIELDANAAPKKKRNFYDT